MKVEPNKKLLFIPFYFYKAVYYSENNQRGCFLEIPVEISLSDKYTSRQYKKKQSFILSFVNKMDDTVSKVSWRTMISLEVLAKVTASRWDHLFLPWCIAGQSHLQCDDDDDDSKKNIGDGVSNTI